MPMTLQPARDWATERGATLFEASAEIIGGFPGYSDRGCQFDNALLRITERFLIVDDGLPRGFAIPLGWIEGTTLVSQPNRDDYALRVFYRIEGTPRLFTIRFRANRIGARGPRRSLRAREVLHEAGILDRFAADPPLQPYFTLPWDQTREFEHENVIWTGRASAPRFIGGELAPSEIWLTTKSLIWGSGDGEGINRIPLQLLMDLVNTRLRDRLGTPVIYVAIGDETTGRYELPFAFDLHTPPDRNFRERGAFLVGLRSRGIADGATAPYHQPWRSNLISAEPPPEEFDHSDENEPEGIDEPAALLKIDQAPTDEPIVVPFKVDAPWSTPDDDAVIQPDFGTEPVRRPGGIASRFLRQPIAAADEQVEEPANQPFFVNYEPTPTLELEQIDESQTDIAQVIAAPAALDEDEDPTEPFAVISATTDAPADDVVLAEWSATTSVELEPADRPITESWSPAAAEPADVPEAAAEPFLPLTTEPWAAVRHYEELAVGGLSEALRVIDDCVAGQCGAPLAEHAPSSWDQARALAELKDLTNRGELSEEAARRRKERLLALGETCVRLRTLIELRDHGFLSVEDLDQKRLALVNALSATLASVSEVPRPISDVA
jgi:hypothetical protein